MTAHPRVRTGERLTQDSRGGASGRTYLTEGVDGGDAHIIVRVDRQAAQRLDGWGTERGQGIRGVAAGETVRREQHPRSSTSGWYASCGDGIRCVQAQRLVGVAQTFDESG